MQETDKPLIIQSDRSLLLDMHSPFCDACRNEIISFAELVKAPEHVHTYAVSSISLWNAASAGLGADQILKCLETWSRFAVPASVSAFIRETTSRFGKIILEPSPDSSRYILTVNDAVIFNILSEAKSLRTLLHPCRTGAGLEKIAGGSFEIDNYERGNVKLALIKLGYPVEDRVPLVKSEHVPLRLTAQLRDYQKDAVDSVLGNLGPGTGYGTVVMPCGSGKTIVGLSIMERLSTRTLILCPNVVAVHQWIREMAGKTDIDMSLVGEYSGEKKEIKPVTVCTYQVLTYRPDAEGDFPHMRVIKEGNWGLVIYDEVHILPAPVFKITAELQSVYRVGLTATLIREDGREEDVFSLVGPKRYDVPWTDLAARGWIAQAYCVEVRLPLPQELAVTYAKADRRERYRIASTNSCKFGVIRALLAKHSGESIIIIGQYLDQLREVKKQFGFPLITGSTSNSRREELYSLFREGKEKVLIVSKVANFAVDLPDASVAIQISGTFGSRQEEAQRLGRILRPKKNPSFFYSVITKYTVEEEFSANRQKFLVEQGYKYIVREV